MSRTNRCRRGFSFERALAKRSSSAVDAVFATARAGTARAGLGFLRESGFFFVVRRKVFAFDKLKGPLRSH